MTASTRLGLATAGSGLLLGVLGNVLMDAGRWGIGLTLWAFVLIAAFWMLRQRQIGGVSAAERGLLVGLCVFALCFPWRDSTSLRTLDLLSLFVLLALLAGHALPVPLAQSGIRRILRGVCLIPFQSLSGAVLLLFRDIPWGTIPRTGWTPHGLAILRGLALAVPVLLVFGGLLAAADAVFSHFIGLPFHWDVDALLDNVCLVILWAWLTTGFLRTSLAVPTPSPALETAAPTPRITLGMIETGTILGLLNLLFLGFVAVQLRYFFGGAALVQATIGLTYAQYARQGFFELVAVAILVLPLLLGLHALQRPDEARAQTLFRGLAGLQILLLFVIMASAVVRMQLYEQEYGLTELRLYTTAFMGWLAVVFAWFAATVLRGARPRFALGVLVSAFAAVVVLHGINPDAAIVRANVTHAQAGHPFDAAYALGLSADAVPTLAAVLPMLPPADQARVRHGLQDEEQALRHGDWRSWSLSRQLAGDTRQ
jgi:hypothetical protein